MTPTPDRTEPPPAGNPPGSTLTAEQIAAIRRRLNAMGRQGYDVDDALVLLDSHAALRDRLAQQEARCEALEGVARAFLREVTRYDNTSLEQRLDMSDGERLAWHERLAGTADDLRVVLAAPTDGAVRWHGMTGAEIMAMTMEVGRLRTQMLRAEHILEDALAAAAGRGADGEAGE